MRTAILCLLLLATVSAVFAAGSQGSVAPPLTLGGWPDLALFGGLGSTLFWCLRRSTHPHSRRQGDRP